MKMWSYLVYVGGTIGVLMVGMWLLSLKGSVRTRPGWLVGVVGIRGGGKSLFCARLIAKRLAEGRPVACNFKVPGAYFVRSAQDCMYLPKRTLVIVDEAWNWFPTTGKLPPTIANWYVSHVRKLKHEVFYLCQDLSQVAGFVKNQTNEIVECERLVGSDDSPRSVHRASSYARHQYGKKDAAALWRWCYSPRGAAIRVYDTAELVRPTDAVPLSVEASNEIITRFIDEYEAGVDFSDRLTMTPVKAMPGRRRRRARRSSTRVDVPVVVPVSDAPLDAVDLSECEQPA